MGKPSMDDYVDVAERIREFRDKHPQGSLQGEVVRWPTEEFPFIAYRAEAYRDPEDPRPGIGWAYENFPGQTNFTRNSELQNAETSAWGRAIVASLAADTKRGIASKQEVQRTSGEPEAQARQGEGRAKPPAPTDDDPVAPGGPFRGRRFSEIVKTEEGRNWLAAAYENPDVPQAVREAAAEWLLRVEPEELVKSELDAEVVA